MGPDRLDRARRPAGAASCGARRPEELADRRVHALLLLGRPIQSSGAGHRSNSEDRSLRATVRARVSRRRARRPARGGAAPTSTVAIPDVGREGALVGDAAHASRRCGSRSRNAGRSRPSSVPAVPFAEARRTPLDVGAEAAAQGDAVGGSRAARCVRMPGARQPAARTRARSRGPCAPAERREASPPPRRLGTMQHAAPAWRGRSRPWPPFGLAARDAGARGSPTSARMAPVISPRDPRGSSRRRRRSPRRGGRATRSPGSRGRTRRCWRCGRPAGTGRGWRASVPA